MTVKRSTISRGAAAALLAVAASLVPYVATAHHAVEAKFDRAQARTFEGVVTAVDWRNPHAHVFVNVTGADGAVANWAIELESPVLLERSGWRRDSLRPGDAIRVEGPTARDGTRQVWGESVVATATGRSVLYALDTAPVAPKEPRPAPRFAGGTPSLAGDLLGGYWGYPTTTVLAEQGANVAMDEAGLLADLRQASRVAPFQPWALGVYQHRQSRHLRDDPMFLNCKPPGGVRQYQSPYGIQFAEDRAGQRIFVLVGSGNRNYRIIYLDGREQQGQVRGDDDNPLYYGRSVGHWEGDTLVVSTTGFNEDFWFTNGGLPHTDRLSLTERFTRVDYDTLRYEVTVDDPGAYTRPWSNSWELRWVGGEELPSYFCQDNRS